MAFGSIATCSYPAVSHAEAQKVKPAIEIGVGPTKLCTLGYVFANKSGKAVGLTAKHCGDTGSAVTTARGTKIGKVIAKAPGETDVSMIAIDTPLPVYTDVDQIGRVTGAISIDEMRTTQPLLCKKGATTGLSCGPLKQIDAGWFSFSAQSAAGDSGAPVYALTRRGTLLAAGVLEGQSKEHPGEIVATPVAPFMQAWELSLP